MRPGGRLVSDRHVIQARPRRSAADLPFEPIERFRLPCRSDFNGAVRGVADPPVQTLAFGCRLREIPEADALNAAANQIPSAEAHVQENERLYWIGVPVQCPVLIVEDDADLREMMAQLLTLEGYRTEAVANGREALKYLHEGHRPDLILLDLMMPIMDGWEFRKRQQDDPTLADLPVVVLTALDQAQARADDLDGVDFLKKPLDFDRLLELVRRHCRPE